MTTVAALYVDPNGAYANLPGVEVWDEARDARTYDGPWPVVAHPPCNRWSVLAFCRPEYAIGDDGGCFAAALAAVRTFGGVLEHPAHTRAWRGYDLPTPARYGWTRSFFDDAWTCSVDQTYYGHDMRKITWLYYTGSEPPPMTWGDGGKRERNVHNHHGWGNGQRSRTPEQFRDVLLAMARNAARERVAAPA
jgi:hypothetical protein